MSVEGANVEGVRSLVERVLGRAADDVDLEVDPALGPGGYSYAADGRTLTVRAGDLGTLGVGFGHYLSDVAGVQVTWDDPEAGRRLARGWPAVEPTTRRTDAQVRYYLNVVTTGYSAPFWGWERWEREIDWMALHGVNTPLMVVGHEAVLAAAFAEAGVSDADVRAWIGGAPYLPWTLMGSISSWGGPLPRGWFDKRVELARRITSRQRELGMRPVLPAFGGHVPDALAGAAARRTTWQGYSTALLDPGSERFRELAVAVGRHQRELIGTDHLYSTDPLIESVPPSPEPEYLTALGTAIWSGLAAVDPQATWVMQAWPFHFKREFWTAERVDAFLRPVPADRLLLLDLWAEHGPVWNDGRGIARRPWVWCAIHNFGARFSLHGDLRGLVRDVARVRQAPEHATFRGTGLAPEAIEQNAVFYELATRLPWDLPDDVDAWVRGFVERRYRLLGADDAVRDAAFEAWRVLGSTVYRSGATRSAPSPVIARPLGEGVPFAGQRSAGEELEPGTVGPPSSNVDVSTDPHVLGDLPELARAATLLAEVTAALGADGPWAADLVDVVTHVVAQRMRVPVADAVESARAGDAAGVRRAASAVLRAIAGLDELAATQHDRLVGVWVVAAEAWGDDDAERATLARDARRILSVWGRQDSGLHDYSGRHWSGLLDGLYLQRWSAWFDNLAVSADAYGRDDAAGNATALERKARLLERITEIEEAWVAGPHRHRTTPTGDVVAIARRLLAQAGALEGRRATRAGTPADHEEGTT